MTAIKSSLEAFLSEHAIIRVWHTAFDCPAGDEHALDTDADGEDYCDEEGLTSILTDWLSLDLGSVEGEVTQDSDGEWRWEWEGGEDIRNCCGNSIFRLVVWGS